MSVDRGGSSARMLPHAGPSFSMGDQSNQSAQLKNLYNEAGSTTMTPVREISLRMMANAKSVSPLCDIHLVPSSSHFSDAMQTDLDDENVKLRFNQPNQDITPEQN